MNQVRSVLDTMPVALFIVDDYSTVEFANKTFLDLVGYSKEEIVDSEVRTLLKKNILERQQDFSSIETTMATRSSEELPVELSVTKLNVGDKERLLYAAIDITERKENQRMRQAFLSMISHDLRNPIASIASFLELVVMGVYGDVQSKIKDGCEISLRNTERLLSLIGDLLELQKFEVGAFSLDIEPSSSKKMIDSSVEALADLAKSKGLVLTASSDDSKAMADSKRVIQVLVNLISNAIKFSPEGSEITVSAQRDGNKVIFKVSDQGRGIAEADLKRIFVAFQQVQESDEQSGTGLGLPISHKLIERQNGSINVESRVGKGSTFSFDLPVAEGNA